MRKKNPKKKIQKNKKQKQNSDPLDLYLHIHMEHAEYTTCPSSVFDVKYRFLLKRNGTLQHDCFANKCYLYFPR